MASRPSSPATSQAEAKISILDPATLGCMLERARRWRAMEKRLAGAVASDSLRHALACIASTVDLKSGDSIAAQRYSIEAEVSRGADLARVSAAFGKTRKQERATMSTASVLALAAGLAGGASALRTSVPKSKISDLPVVLALLESQLEGPSLNAVLGLATQRKLPLVIVALRGAFETQPPDNFAAYEIDRFPRIPADRADPIAIYRVAHEGIERARIGYGPTLVDCVEWPFGAAEDPFQTVERHALSLGMPIRREKLEAQFVAELNRATSEPEVALFAPE